MKDYELEDYIADLKIELDDAEMDLPRNEYIRTHRHEEDKPVSNSPTCWGTLQDEEFVPAFTSVPKVPSGIYEVVWNRQLNQHTLKKQPFKTDGILMYGEPGCGKSGIIQLISKQLIENDGIIINIKDQDDVDHFMDFIATFRKIEPNRPLIVLLEDIDSIAGENSHSTSRLLNILDGVKQIEDVVYIATTNYPEKLQDRITNRPSRFDRRYKVELPNDEIREAYIRHKLTDEDIKNVDINEWVKRTEGMSLSHLKEVVISTIVMGREFEEVMDNLEGLKKAPSIKGSGIVGFGK